MKDIIDKAFKRHAQAVQKSVESIMPDIEKAADILLTAINGGSKMLVCGNGGSAADAQHFAAEFLCRYHENRRPLPAIALTTNTSALTAISNDYDFEHIFSRQVQALGLKGDVLVALTTSGKSKNILLAIDEANSRGLKVIALTGSGGARLRDKAHAAIVVPSSETARVQEVHEIIYHIWCELIDVWFINKPSPTISG